MRFHTKLLLIYTFLLILTVSVPAAYMFFTVKNSNIEHAEHSLSGIRNLLTQSVSAEYRDISNRNLQELVGIRQDISDIGLMILRYFTHLQHHSYYSGDGAVLEGEKVENLRREVLHMMQEVKRSYNATGLDVIMSIDGKILLQPSLSGLTAARSIENNDIKWLHRPGTPIGHGFFMDLHSQRVATGDHKRSPVFVYSRDSEQSEDEIRDLHFRAVGESRQPCDSRNHGGVLSATVPRHPDAEGSVSAAETAQMITVPLVNPCASGVENYLSYTFPLHMGASYRVTLVRNINDVLQDYESISSDILKKIENTLVTPSSFSDTRSIFIVDASTGEILLTSASQEHLKKSGFSANTIPDDFLRILQKDHLEFLKLKEHSQIDAAHRQMQESIFNDYTRQGASPTSAGSEKKVLSELTADRELGFVFHDSRHRITYNYFKPLNWFLIVTSDDPEGLNDALRQGIILLLLTGALILLFICLMYRVYTQRVNENIALICNQIRDLSEADFRNMHELNTISGRYHRLNNSDLRYVHQELENLGKTISNRFTTLLRINTEISRNNSAVDLINRMHFNLMTDSMMQAGCCDRFLSLGLLRAAHDAGSDFYDSYMIDEEHLALVTGDIFDDIMQASELMIRCIRKTRSTMFLKKDPAICCTELRDALGDTIVADCFCYITACVININTGRYSICSAGNNHPVIIGETDCRLMHYPTGQRISPDKSGVYAKHEGVLEKGSAILFLSDGLTGAVNENKEPFGLHRLFPILNAHKSEEPQQILDAVVAAVDGYRKSEPLIDDYVMLYFKRL